MAPSLQRIQTHKQGSFTTTTCPHCSAALEYLAPPQLASSPAAEVELECAVCKKCWVAKEGKKDARTAKANGEAQGTKRDKQPAAGKRKIGTGAWLFAVCSGV